ncbi:MAG: thioredoxin family protein [Anaerolineales bacterium]|nr:thioredoxin family protein [Anaerolineales bacterium]
MSTADVLTRAVIAFAIILGGLGIYFFYNWTLQLRTRSLIADLEPIRPGAFTLVYFTTPTCVPCKTIQRPAIQTLSQKLGNTLRVVEIDATEKPEVASRWGVMSVPTTFVIDPHGKLRHVNHGVTRTEKFLKQIYGADHVPSAS